MLREFEQLKVPMCLINAYPYRGVWCNDGWLSVWECESREAWMLRASKTMENWSHATHAQMRGLRDRVQIDKQTAVQSYHIYRNEKRKLISVYQRPFEYEGETLVLYELIPEDGLIRDTMKRSIEGFRYIVPLVSLFDLHGSLLQQNPSGSSFYKELLAEEAPGITPLRRILGHDVLHSKILKLISSRGTASIVTVKKDQKRHRVTRRSMDATYGLDPVTGQKMLILSESYSIESKAYDGESSFEIFDAVRPQICTKIDRPGHNGEVSVVTRSADDSVSLSLANAMVRRGGSLSSSASISYPNTTESRGTSAGTSGKSSSDECPSPQASESDVSSKQEKNPQLPPAEKSCPTEEEERLRAELDHYKQKCKQLIRRCRQLAVIGTGSEA